MKWTILGFSQRELINLEITLDEALILRYFVDFKDSEKMVKEYLKDDMYYWINYQKLKEQLPILNISKDRVYRKLKHLCKVGVLKHKTKRKGGIFSFYALGDKYSKLIADNTVKITKPYGENNGTHTVKITEPYGKNNGTKDSSIKDESTKEYICSSSSKEQLSEIYKLYQELGFGLPNRIIAEMIADDVKKYSKEWFMEALKIAVKENKLKLSYVEGILQNWKRNGGITKAGDKNANGSMQKPKYNNKKTKSTAGEERAEQYDLSDL